MPTDPINHYSAGQHVVVDGKFFRLGREKFYIKGVTYGPFAPNEHGETFPEPDQVRRDFTQIAELGANVLRVYYVPPRWFLDLVTEYGLKVLLDVPWPKHLCFLDSRDAQVEARCAVRQAVIATRRHPAVFAYSVANEISAEIVRWSGVRRVERFIDSLIEEAKRVDPQSLCTFTSYLPTEFLQPQSSDFISFNLYLHDSQAYSSYLARLQTLAGAKPLILGESGMDTIREREDRKCEFLRWQIEGAFRSGLAGTIVFSYTDDWFSGGLQIEDWAFGLTRRDRQPKESFRVVQKQFQAAPYFPLPRPAKVSVVVSTYNGARTLHACLDSLQRLNYPDYEVIVVDDGSTDATSQIAARHVAGGNGTHSPIRFSHSNQKEGRSCTEPKEIDLREQEDQRQPRNFRSAEPVFRYIRHQKNLGLAVARNTGIAAATGEIIAFTDDDSRMDEDWLYYIVGDLLRSDFVGIGGHNFLPPEDSCVAAAVLVSPGGPAHVMLTDHEAEHIPGCNMAFYKWALEEILGFDPIFHKAGDDVDVCWRLQERNYKIGFSHAGFVWHYRRSTLMAYLKQQAGYGEAEALLSQKHPAYFNSIGGNLWRGRIYNPASFGIVLAKPMIYHGIFGSGFLQRLYAPEPTMPLMLFTSLGYHLFINIPLLVLSAYMSFLFPVALVSVLLSLGVCLVAAIQARLPQHKERFWSRALVALLFFLQPLVRKWGQFRQQLKIQENRSLHLPEIEVADADVPEVLHYWSDGAVNRYQFLQAVQENLARQACAIELGTGWSRYDMEITGNRWSRLRLTTVTEELELGKKTFLCRLDVSWPLQARLLFWMVAAAELLIVALFAGQIPWLWLLPVTLPLLYGSLARQGQYLRTAITSSLDDAAHRISLVKLRR